MKFNSQSLLLKLISQSNNLRKKVTKCSDKYLKTCNYLGSKFKLFKEYLKK